MQAMNTGISSDKETKKAPWFFALMALVLIVIVAVGFTPSFYAPGAFGTAEAARRNVGAPAYIFAHGILMTIWYLLFFAQALLIANAREPIHRRLGVIGVIVATAIVPLNAFVNVRAVSRSGLEPLPVLGNFATILLYAILVTVAIRYRHKPGVHKRLMLVASITLTSPALARWPGAESAVPLSVVIPQLVLLAALAAYDFATRRRVHRATGWGIAAYVVAIGTVVPLAMSDLGQWLVNSLK